MLNQNQLDQFMNKVKKMEKGEKLDLSSDEDLSIAVMNLISIEEHLFFSGGKTGKVSFFELLQEVREMRKQLLKMLIKDYEGEVWCISKHLLAASMRLMEVGTKALNKGDKDQAYDLFKKSYDLYNLFWGMNLGLVKPSSVSENTGLRKDKERPIEYTKTDLNQPDNKSFFGKISSVIGKIVDCCKE